MRRYLELLVASLPLLPSLASAKLPGFSPYDDVLAHPQFDIVFSDSYIREKDALALLESSQASKPQPSGGPSASTDSPAQADSDEDNGEIEVSETYEIINLPQSRYLCAIPTIAPPPALNHTANELAKAEEARELNRAYNKGWELMSGLEGQCLYYMSGWWSYSFCYGKDIVQFHAQPQGSKAGPPVRDSNTQEYVLGRTSPAVPYRAQSGNQAHHQQQQTTTNNNQVQKQTEGAGHQQQDGSSTPTPGSPPPNTELQVKGDQRYLVQRLGGGTICDLTNRPRTIEIQYHCNPNGIGDRIGWIKEVMTCTYVMVVQTPRLCSDAAFLPPRESRAHTISCQQVVGSSEEEEAWRRAKTIEAAEAMTGGGTAATVVGTGAATGRTATTSGTLGSGGVGSGRGGLNPYAGMNIGGMVIGGQKLLGNTDGHPPHKLVPPRDVRHAAQQAAAEVFAPLLENLQLVQDGTMEVMTEEDLRELDIDEETLRVLQEEVRKYAARGGADGEGGGDVKWTVKIHRPAGEGQGGDHDDEPGEWEVVEVPVEEVVDQRKKGGKLAAAPKTDSGGSGGRKKGAKGQEADDEEGSQEQFYKDEL